MSLIMNDNGSSTSHIKEQLSMASLSTIQVNGTLSNPSYLSGLLAGSSNSTGLTAELTNGIDEGAILNSTGKTISMTGSIAYLSVFTGFSGVINVWSERSTDGINWTPNQSSFRSWDVSFISGGSVTQKSAVIDWADGEYIRFAFASSGGGALSFESISETVNGSQTVSSVSVYWTLIEL